MNTRSAPYRKPSSRPIIEQFLQEHKSPFIAKVSAHARRHGVERVPAALNYGIRHDLSG